MRMVCETTYMYTEHSSYKLTNHTCTCKTQRQCKGKHSRHAQSANFKEKAELPCSQLAGQRGQSKATKPE